MKNTSIKFIFSMLACYRLHKFTFASSLALVIGNTVGSGIYLLPASLASIGSISLYAWIFSTIGALSLALIFSIFSRKIKNTGGPYIYVKQILGEFMGFQTAFSYWISIWIGNAAIAVALISYLSVLQPYLMEPEISCVMSLIVIWVATALNMLSVKSIGQAQIFFNILKFAPLVLISTLGWAYVQKDFYSQYYNLSHESNFYAISAAIPITLWAFIGIESATIPSGLVYKPSIIIPLATMLGVVVAAIIYITSTSAALGIVNPQVLQYSISPFADATEVIIGITGKYFIAFSAALSCFGCLHGWTLLQGQIAMAAANDGLLPAIFARKNQEDIPIWGLFITSMLITVLILATSYTPLNKQFLNLILLATVASIMPYIYTAIAFMKLHTHIKNKKYKLLCMFIALVAFLYSLWALLSVNVHILFYYGIIFLIGTVSYQILKYKIKRHI